MSESLPEPTMMTVYFEKTGNVNFKTLFYCLPVYIKNNKGEFIKEQKKLSDYNGVPGKIISIITGNNNYRGIKFEGKVFLNCITIRLSLSTGKTVTLKIFNDNFHVSGCTNYEDVEETKKSFIKIIKDLIDNINFIKNNNDVFVSCLSYIKENCKGEKIEEINIGDETKTIEDILSEDLHHIKFISDEEIKENSPNYETTKFLLSYAYDTLDFTDFESYFNRISTFNLTKDIVPMELGKRTVDGEIIDNFNIPMSNYNYKLGFEIDRKKLVKLIKEKYIDFLIIFKPNIHIHVKIILPVLNDDGELLLKSDVPKENLKQIESEIFNRYANDKYRKRNKLSNDEDYQKTSFTIYKNGHITQSSPGPEKAEKARIKFDKLINEIKAEIMIENQN